MNEAELYWTKAAAIGQIAGAGATLLAVAVSLWIALYGLRPKLKLSAGERLVIGNHAGEDQRVFMFKIANVGERPVQVLSLGWQTGWLPFGPAFLKKQYAVQMFNSVPWSASPPFELPVGREVSAHVFMENLLDFSEQRQGGEPFFTRDYPMRGRAKTRVRASAHLAGGRIIHCTVEPSAAEKLCSAEIPQAGTASA